ncbi:hypothetical protein RclHR1_07230015 [Rhizophagus clarus]|uniref:Uncharacterized protein n=1 Tax=Rhizophagus clarus TaxID=94130 RepID=A0A2Z6RVD4_9GLOM|nr:hypothetical protein RclHR1_07230015 [Rhizophagus clarus]
MEYEIENINNLKKRCEKAMKIIPKYGDFTKNNFSINKEKFSDIIKQWQHSYPELYEELESWKGSPGFTHETLLRRNKNNKIESVFLKIYESEEIDFLNCVNISRNYPKPSKISKVRNMIFKRKSVKNFNQLIKSHPEIMAALVLSGDNENGGLKILWREVKPG